MLAELVELAPTGFEQVDGDGFVEFALYGAPGELPALGTGPAEIAGVRVEVSGTEVGDDWADRWREFHKPVQVGRLYIRPPWTEPLTDSIDVVIDPAQAFGTGAHPTTRLCLELLQEVGAAGNGRHTTKNCGTADLGCGSGVLAIAAAKLGFTPVSAFDHDNGCARGDDRERPCERRNARARGALRSAHAARAGRAPVTVANLMRPLLLRVAELLPEQPETLIVSGLLEGEEEEVAAAFASLRERRRVRLQGWSALLMTRP